MIRILIILLEDIMSYHKLMMENHTMFSRKVFERLSDRCLSVGQPKVLEYLYFNDGAIQKDIAEACMIEPATVTSLLSRMEKGGLIKRKSRVGDKRYMCVYLTEIGRENSKISVETLLELEKIALSGFSEEERKRFVSFLERVNSNLKGKGGADI